MKLYDFLFYSRSSKLEPLIEFTSRYLLFEKNKTKRFLVNLAVANTQVVVIYFPNSIVMSK